MPELSELFTKILGLNLDSMELNAWHMSARAIVVFIFGIIMLRIGHKRFLGKNSTFDILMCVIVGSVISRAITGNSAFFPTIAASFTLVLFHYVLAALAYNSSLWGKFIKGCERCLIKDGELQKDALRKTHITEHDLQEAMRVRGFLPDFSQVKAAYLERNGNISIIVK